jgi:hypothetical protein
MEPRGCNLWQPVANAASPESGEIKPKPLSCVATGCDGKEGVDGSSPSEGFEFRLLS